MINQRIRKSLPLAPGRRTACRSVLSLILLVIIMGLPAFSVAQQACQPDGDVDRSGSVTAADALLAFQQALGLAQLTACQQTIANVFPQPAAPDANITASDALCIFQKALSLPSCLDTLPSPNQPPVVNAGADRSVDAGTAVTLSGVASDSDGTITRYAWTQTGGTRVSLAGAATATATFTAPNVSADETLTFRLTVTDNSGAQASDEVRITVRRSNQPPVADAGLEQFVFGNEVVILSGLGSSDADGTIVGYRWVQTSGPPVTLSGADTPNASFTAPEVTFENLLEELEFQLTVTDDDGASDTAVVLVLVIYDPFANEPPTANAGVDQIVSENTLVTLSGSGMDPDGFIVGYNWFQLIGTPVELIGWDTPNPSFIAPEVDSDEDLVFELTVYDDAFLTPATDTVTITVLNATPNTPPVADAGRDQTVDENMVVTLDGSASRDSDGTIVSYTWSQISGTPVNISGADSARATFQAPEVSVDTTLVFQLRVEDDDGVTATDRVVVTIEGMSLLELTVSVFGEGAVQIAGGHDLECDVPHICHAVVPEGTNVVLEAIPMSGYAIDRWLGCDSVSNDTCTVATYQDQLVSVYFLSTAPLQLKDDVATFEADRVDEIEDFDIDSGLLVMSADADIGDLRIGDVIVSNVIDPDREFPTYFLRRIRDIQKLPGGTGYIRTVQATLEDAIASGSLSSGSTPPSALGCCVRRATLGGHVDRTWARRRRSWVSRWPLPSSTDRDSADFFEDQPLFHSWPLRRGHCRDSYNAPFRFGFRYFERCERI